MDHSSQDSLFEIPETSRSWPSIFLPAALEAVDQDQGQLIVFSGHRGLFPLGHYLMVWRLLQEESVIVVDGANIFDLHLITRLANDLKADPRNLLQRIHLTRAFTVHQLQSVISDRLEGALKKYGSRLCLVSGLLDTFWDEEVPLWEASRILKSVIGKLRSLTAQNHRVVLLAPDPPVPMAKRMGLISLVKKNVDRVFGLSEAEGILTMREETKSKVGKRWVLPSLQLPTKRYSAR
jgi:hypothetical protein